MTLDTQPLSELTDPEQYLSESLTLSEIDQAKNNEQITAVSKSKSDMNACLKEQGERLNTLQKDSDHIVGIGDKSQAMYEEQRARLTEIQSDVKLLTNRARSSHSFRSRVERIAKGEI